jgi:hypothetical protein
LLAIVLAGYAFRLESDKILFLINRIGILMTFPCETFSGRRRSVALAFSELHLSEIPESTPPPAPSLEDSKEVLLGICGQKFQEFTIDGKREFCRWVFREDRSRLLESSLFSERITATSIAALGIEAFLPWMQELIQKELNCFVLFPHQDTWVDEGLLIQLSSHDDLDPLSDVQNIMKYFLGRNELEACLRRLDERLPLISETIFTKLTLKRLNDARRLVDIHNPAQSRMYILAVLTKMDLGFRELFSCAIQRYCETISPPVLEKACVLSETKTTEKMFLTHLALFVDEKELILRVPFEIFSLEDLYDYGFYEQVALRLAHNSSLIPLTPPFIISGLIALEAEYGEELSLPTPFYVALIKAGIPIESFHILPFEVQNALVEEALEANDCDLLFKTLELKCLFLRNLPSSKRTVSARPSLLVSLTYHPFFFRILPILCQKITTELDNLCEKVPVELSVHLLSANCNTHLQMALQNIDCFLNNLYRLRERNSLRSRLLSRAIEQVTESCERSVLLLTQRLSCDREYLVKYFDIPFLKSYPKELEAYCLYKELKNYIAGAKAVRLSKEELVGSLQEIIKKFREVEGKREVARISYALEFFRHGRTPDLMGRSYLCILPEMLYDESFVDLLDGLFLSLAEFDLDAAVGFAINERLITVLGTLLKRWGAPPYLKISRSDLGLQSEFQYFILEAMSKYAHVPHIMNRLQYLAPLCEDIVPAPS